MHASAHVFPVLEPAHYQHLINLSMQPPGREQSRAPCKASRLWRQHGYDGSFLLALQADFAFCRFSVVGTLDAHEQGHRRAFYFNQHLVACTQEHDPCYRSVGPKQML